MNTKKLLLFLLLFPALAFGQHIRTSQTNLSIVNVLDYGAVGDSTTDNTTAFRNAIAALPAAGGEVLIPKAGKYIISDTLLVTHPTIFMGVGGLGAGTTGDITNQPAVTIIMTSATKDAFVINAHKCEFYNIGISNNQTSAPTAGHGILLNDAVGFRMEYCTVEFFYDNVQFVNGYLWDIRACLFKDPVKYNLIIGDAVLPDGDDSNLSDCWFYAGKYAGASHIRYTSGGGLKCNNLKFNSTNTGQNPLHCFDIEMASNTVDNIITNCSLENFSGSALYDVPGSGVTYTDIIFTDNQITAGGSWTGSGGYSLVQIGNTSYYPSGVVIDDNDFHNIILGSVSGSTYSGYNIFTSGTNVTIGSGNEYFSGTNGTSDNIYVYSSTNLNFIRQGTFYTIPYVGGFNYDIRMASDQLALITQNTTIGFNTYGGTTGLYPTRFILRILENSTGGYTVTIGGATFNGNKNVNTTANGYTVFSGYYDPATSAVELTNITNNFLGSYTIAALNTGITGQYAGNLAFATDNSQLYVFNGTTWGPMFTFSTGLTATGTTVTNNLSTGVSGGQTAYGGTAASNNLNFSSTTNGTKGYIYFGPPGVPTAGIQESTGYIGAGTGAPIAYFDNGGLFGGSVIGARIGGLFSSSYSAYNTFFGNNMYESGGYPTRYSTGVCSGFQFALGEILAVVGGSNSGSTGIQTYPFKVDYGSTNGSVYLGGSISAGNNTSTGSMMYVLGSGGVFLNTSFSTPWLNKAGSAYTLGINDNFLTGDATGGSFAFTLPTAVGYAGLEYTLQRTDATSNTISIGTTSSQTINGSSTYSLSSQYAYVRVKSNGTNWLIVDASAPATLITGTPTIAAGAGAGTSPTVSVTTNGKQLQVTVTTGTLPTGTNATIATVTLPNALSYTPYPVFSGANANTSLLSAASMVYMTSSGTANVTITSGTTALTAATTYVWNISL